MTRLLQGRGRGDRGVVAIFVAVCLIAMLTVAALVIDGGTGYTQRRSMQNAADTAAMAGARALDRYRFSGGSAGDVNAQVQTIATQNGADSVTCTVIEWDQDPIGPCSVTANVADNDASGVAVTTTNTRQAAFGGVTDTASLTATAEAAATIQPVIGSDQPFIMCGSWSANESKQMFSPQHPLWNRAGSFLNPDGTVNTTVLNQMGEIPIQSSKVAKCGAGDAFKGKKGGTQPIRLGDWAEANNGNGYEQTISDTVLGGTPCPSGGPFDNCDILVPIADAGSGNGEDIDMHIVTWTVWHIRGDGLGDPKYYATYRADLTQLSSGVGGEGTVTNGSTIRVIKLVA